MTLALKEMGTPRPKMERIPEGTFMGRIASIIDLGVQPQTDWQTGEATDPKPRVLITWELPSERIDIEQEDGSTESKARWISKEYTLSNFDQSNLMKLIKALAPDGLERLEELLDTACMVNVGSTVNGNAKIVGVMPAPVGMEVDALEQEARYFDFDDPSEDLYLMQPNWIKEKVKEAINYTGFADNWDTTDDNAPF